MGRLAALPVATAEAWREEEARIRAAYGRRTNPARYSWFNRAHLLGMQEIERVLLAMLERHGITSLEGLDVLDVGCGTALWLREFVKWGASPERLQGLDLLPDRIDTARRLCPPDVGLHCGSASDLGWPDETFDLVLQSMMFSSVLDGSMRRRIAGEILRVMRPTGLALWYDYRVDNPANPDVRGVSRAEILQLFPGCRADLQRVTLAPPLARFVAPRSVGLHRALSQLPWLRTHYLAVIRKR
jgi:ubiquinone/menaquinone biosynthesis C-methylase UbiE